MKHLPRSKKAWLLLLASLLVVTWVTRHYTADDDQQLYQKARVDRGDIAQTVAANGQLNPVKLVSVGTQVSGIVRSYSADFNDRVSEGQVLMQLDNSLLKSQLAQSHANLSSVEASLVLARNNWQRIQPLAKLGFASTQELDQSRQALHSAEAALSQAKAQVQRDQTSLGYAVIRSPVSGVVVLRAVDVGQTVAASFQTPELYKIAKDLREMVIDAYFSESDIGEIHVGQPARFRVDAFPNKVFQGVVKQVRLNPKTEQNVVTYDVVIAVRNEDQKLLPGMTAYVSIATEVHKNVLRVPTAALRFKPAEGVKIIKPTALKAPQNTHEPALNNAHTASTDRPRNRGKVWRQTHDGLEMIPVHLGVTDRQYTEVITSTLKLGDEVITDIAQSDDEDGHPKGMKFRMKE